MLPRGGTPYDINAIYKLIPQKVRLMGYNIVADNADLSSFV